MAAGDVFGYLVQVAGSTNSNYQPAAGVEICITSCAFSNPAGTKIRFIDGVVVQPAFITYPTSMNGQGFLNMKIMITNTNYLQIRNDGGSAADFGFSGIQLK